jgi:8-oxo-dGTP pyrophosphatase MutT (NUDIX family)
MEALYREAREEIGLTDFNPVELDTYVWESDTEREWVNAYAAVGNFDLHPVNDEVDEGRYWTEEEIAEALGKGILTPNFENEYQRVGRALQALL